MTEALRSDALEVGDPSAAGEPAGVAEIAAERLRDRLLLREALRVLAEAPPLAPEALVDPGRGAPPRRVSSQRKCGRAAAPSCSRELLASNVDSEIAHKGVATMLSMTLGVRSKPMKATLCLLLVGLASAGSAEEVAAPPAVGSAAPAFELQDQTGARHTLASYAGKWLVLYFYPKDGTPGCTKEVCAFRDSISKVQRAGAEVAGVSLDDVDSHKEFAEKHKVPFPLLADVDGSTSKAYGVLTSKLGFRYARRDTFLIDPHGKIAEHYPDVDPEKNVSQVLDDLARLGAPPGPP